jgi:hypothetical protein
MASDVLKAREAAFQFIKTLRITNGGMTDEDRQFLIEHGMTAVIASFDSLRRKLGAATQT